MAQAIKPLGEVWMELTDHRKFAKLVLLAGLSQRGLAQMLGFESHTYINRLAKGEVKTVTPETAAKICVALDLAMTDLFVPKTTNIPVRKRQEERLAA